MKHYLLFITLLGCFFASCTKEEIVIIDEEEVLIDSVDMDRFCQNQLSGFKSVQSIEFPRKGTMQYRFLSLPDSLNIVYRVSPFDSYQESRAFIAQYVQSISAGMTPATEDMNPLGNEYWWFPSPNAASLIIFRRNNLVIEVFSHQFSDVTPFARMLDIAILNRAEYVYYENVQPINTVL